MATNGNGHKQHPRRVVITGMGTINPLGLSVAETWNSLLEGRRIVKPIERFDPSGFMTRIAAQVDSFDIDKYDHLVSKKEARRMDIDVQYALAATAEALDDAEFRVESDAQGDSVGNIIGSGIGGLETMYEGHKTLLEKGPMRVSPFASTQMLPNMGSGVVGITFNLRGPSYAIVSACATGNHSIGEAYEIIKRGDAEVMVAGGTEAPITPFGLAAFHRTTALTQRNDDPAHASRPFDKDRDGFIISEGAAVIVLETLEHAQSRGATIYAELVGYGASTDAYHTSSPPEGGEGAARAIKRALDKSGVAATEIDYINAHGTSTPLNDKAESAAIKAALGDHAYQVPISSTKSMSGHLLGAAGALEAIVAVKTIQTGTIHPTINLDNPDLENGCDLDYVPNTARHADVRTVLSNSFGFGGHNAALLFRKFEE